MKKPADDIAQTPQAGQPLLGRRHLAALGAYLAFSCLLLLPIGGDIQHQQIAEHSWNSALWLWCLKYWPWAIAHGHNPLYTQYVWHPVGQNVAWCTSIPTLAILAWPVTFMFGPLVVYNLLALAAPALAALATMLLCEAILAEKTAASYTAAAFIGGWLFGFSPYLAAQLLCHINLAMSWPIPLLGWLALAMLQGRLSTLLAIMLIAIALAALFGISVELFADTVAAGTFLLALAWLNFRPQRPAIGRLAVVGAVAGGTALVLVAPGVWAMLLGHLRPRAGAGNSPYFNHVATAAILRPTSINAIGEAMGIARNLAVTPLAEQVGYIGLPMLLALAIGAIELRRDRAGRFIFIATGVSLACSLGPLAQIGPLAIATPEFVLAHTPLLRYALPNRFAVFTDLFCAAAVANWLARSRVPAWAKWPAAGIVVVSLLPAFTSGLWASTPP
ncbi:MAG: hypothetical protein ACP5QA_16020, partial [Phycisphaerae bacterium]